MVYKKAKSKKCQPSDSSTGMEGPGYFIGGGDGHEAH